MDFGIKKNETPIARKKFGIDLEQIKLEPTMRKRRIVKPADPALEKEAEDRKRINTKKTTRASKFCIRCNTKMTDANSSRKNKRCDHCIATIKTSNMQQTIFFTKEEEVAIIKKCNELGCSVYAYLVQLYRNNLGLNNNKKG